jgi:hypothetical protein
MTVFIGLNVSSHQGHGKPTLTEKVPPHEQGRGQNISLIARPIGCDRKEPFLERG